VSGRWIGTNESIWTFGHYAGDCTAVLPEVLLEMTRHHGANRRAMGTAGARVAFVCMASAHQRKNGALVDHLTVHEREWAYCPSDVRMGGHEWKSTGGVTLGEVQILVRGRRERGSADARAEGR
jgi:hypothetical protein